MIRHKVTSLIGILMLLVLFTSIFSGNNNQTFNYPNKEELSLVAEVSKTELTVGEEIEVIGIFRNMSYIDYRFINSFASFSNSGLIAINIVKIDQPELFFVGASRGGVIKAKSEVGEKQKFKLEEKGKYKVLVAANFDIKNPRTNEYKSYNYKTDPIVIEVN